MAVLEAARRRGAPDDRQVPELLLQLRPAGPQATSSTSRAWPAHASSLVAAVVFVVCRQPRRAGGRSPGPRSAHDRPRDHDRSRAYLVDTGTRKGLTAWLTTTDHKRIGLLYLVRDDDASSSWAWASASSCAWSSSPSGQTLMHRPDLQRPVHAPRRDHDLPVRDPRPAGGLRQLLPADPDRRQGRGLPAAQPALLVLLHDRRRSWPSLSLFTGGGPPDTGWTFYVPYSLKTGTNVSLAVFARLRPGLLLDPHGHQLHHHHPPPAGARA